MLKEQEFFLKTSDCQVVMNAKKFVTFFIILFVSLTTFYLINIYPTLSADMQQTTHPLQKKASDLNIASSLNSSSNLTSAVDIKYIPDSIIAMSSGYIIVVDKKYQKIYVFNKSDSYSKVFEAPCSTGKNPGTKQIAGDAKTPNGIFFATSILHNPGPPETYGSLAFTLDYPTLSDKRAGKEGNNIWIHGTTKALLPQQSNGCVVLNDSDLKQLTSFIYLNRTPVIISESVNWVPQNYLPDSKDDLEKILTSWNKAFSEKDMNKIDSLYFEGATIKGKKREELHEKIKNSASLGKHFVLEPKDISILQEGNNAVMMFDQIYAVNHNNSFQGFYNKLILEKINNSWYVVDESSAPEISGKHLASAKNKQRESTTDSHAVEKEIKTLVKKWLNSWESGNINTYRSCYSSEFESRDMNLDAWIAHKLNVRQNSKNINIRINNLKISVNGNNAKAFFVQRYSSSRLNSRGKKTLELRKIGSQWKIYREIMS